MAFWLPCVRVDLPLDADAAHPCRPTVSCTADIVAPGALEAEVGAYAAKLGGESRLTNFPVLLKQSFTRSLQLQVGSNGYTALRTDAGSAHHVDNLVVGPKLHLVDQGPLAPSFALSAAGSVAAFARGPDAALLTAYASKDVGPVHFDANVGANVLWLDTLDAAAAQPFVAVAASATPVAPFGVALEGYAFGAARPYAAHDGGVRAAATLSPRSWLVFDVGGDIGFFPSTHSYGLFFGVTAVPVVFWREGTHSR